MKLCELTLWGQTFHCFARGSCDTAHCKLLAGAFSKENVLFLCFSLLPAYFRGVGKAVRVKQYFKPLLRKKKSVLLLFSDLLRTKARKYVLRTRSQTRASQSTSSAAAGLRDSSIHAFGAPVEGCSELMHLGLILPLLPSQVRLLLHTAMGLIHHGLSVTHWGAVSPLEQWSHRAQLPNAGIPRSIPKGRDAPSWWDRRTAPGKSMPRPSSSSALRQFRAKAGHPHFRGDKLM